MLIVGDDNETADHPASPKVFDDADPLEALLFTKHEVVQNTSELNSDSGMYDKHSTVSPFKVFVEECGNGDSEIERMPLSDKVNCVTEFDLHSNDVGDNIVEFEVVQSKSYKPPDVKELSKQGNRKKGKTYKNVQNSNYNKKNGVHHEIDSAEQRLSTRRDGCVIKVNDYSRFKNGLNGQNNLYLHSNTGSVVKVNNFSTFFKLDIPSDVCSTSSGDVKGEQQVNISPAVISSNQENIENVEFYGFAESSVQDKIVNNNSNGQNIVSKTNKLNRNKDSSNVCEFCLGEACIEKSSGEDITKKKCTVEFYVSIEPSVRDKIVNNYSNGQKIVSKINKLNCNKDRSNVCEFSLDEACTKKSRGEDIAQENIENVEFYGSGESSVQGKIVNENSDGQKIVSKTNKLNRNKDSSNVCEFCLDEPCIKESRGEDVKMRTGHSDKSYSNMNKCDSSVTVLCLNNNFQDIISNSEIQTANKRDTNLSIPLDIQETEPAVAFLSDIQSSVEEIVENFTVTQSTELPFEDKLDNIVVMQTTGSCDESNIERSKTTNFISNKWLGESVDDDYRQRKYKCTYCKSKFQHYGYLLRHQKKHAEKRFVCDHCHKVFEDVKTFSNHLLTSKHYSSDPYICTYTDCNKMFKSKSGLERHEKSHESKTYHKFTCRFCAKSFADNSALKKHMQTHSENRPYNCTGCEKKFKNIGDLNSHLNTHGSKRLFSCEVCESEFFKRSNLIRHQKIHSEGKYACKLCNTTFKYAGTLTRHMLAEHPITLMNELIPKPGTPRHKNNLYMKILKAKKVMIRPFIT